jgi:hemerythrin-like domain-containing protein
VKRSPELAPLSRDHHVALEVALRLRRADAERAGDAIARFTRFWEDAGRRHFEIEEELILPALPGDDADWADAAARVRREHDEIRARAAALGEAPAAAGPARELGDLLHDHVRFEERVLFGMLEDRLDAPSLAALGAAIERAEHA